MGRRLLHLESHDDPFPQTNIASVNLKLVAGERRRSAVKFDALTDGNESKAARSEEAHS